MRLDANFDETWGDKLELKSLLLEHGENKGHTVEIRLSDGRMKTDAVPFYLVCDD